MLIKSLALLYSAVMMTLWLVPSSAATPLSNQCSGIDVMYPKAGTVMRQTSSPSQYIVLSNEVGAEAKLEKVDLEYQEDENIRAENVYQTSAEEITRVLIVQQDLNRLQVTLPHQFWYRIHVLQNGIKCVYKSETFEINKN